MHKYACFWKSWEGEGEYFLPCLAFVIFLLERIQKVQLHYENTSVVTIFICINCYARP
jgi:hypothetical protein